MIHIRFANLRLLRDSKDFAEHLIQNPESIIWKPGVVKPR